MISYACAFNPYSPVLSSPRAWVLLAGRYISRDRILHSLSLRKLIDCYKVKTTLLIGEVMGGWGGGGGGGR